MKLNEITRKHQKMINKNKNSTCFSYLEITEIIKTF